MKILIVKMSSLGDLIHAFPLLQFLKQTIPFVEIDWVVERPFAELVRAHPFVSNVLTVETKKWRAHLAAKATWQEMRDFRKELRKNTYDMVLDLQGNCKSACVTASAKSPLKIGFGYATVPEWPNLLATHKRYNPPPGANIREDYLYLAQSAFEDFTPVHEKGIQLKIGQKEQGQLNPILEKLDKVEGLKIMVCPGSNWANKQLSPETLRAFLQHLSKKRMVHFLFLWGHKAEKDVAEQLALSFTNHSTLVDKISLPALQNLMGFVDLVVAMDSLPLHLAETTATPTYSIFGPSAAHKYKPVGEHHEAFQGGCPYGQKFIKRCDKLRTCKTGACMKTLGGQELFDHFEQWWVREKRVNEIE